MTGTERGSGRWAFAPWIAEMIGAFALVFFGTGAIVMEGVTRGAIGHVGVAITFGLVILVMIDAFGDVSGAHFNPAVSIGFCLARRFPVERLIPYIIAQCLGAVLASVILRLMFPDAPALGATHPVGSTTRAFVLEVILTFLLMLVILRVSQGSNEQGMMAGVAIGSMVLLAALFGGPISGASMNPARSLAPALVAMDPRDLWLYFVAPTLGAACAPSPGAASVRPHHGEPADGSVLFRTGSEQDPRPSFPA